ncbi:multidrug effflux MFS transporter [Nocardioides solisilvae]|uniref:multidrug effflux MFS transporter n=1 Tax=Nocardioides solisilvae TaxID=1542435 RepID=UPI00194E7315|nr:multidrug effflux MFS transporter [Nocardioides solisilvae]
MTQTTPLDPRSRRALVAVPVVLAMLSMIGPFSIDTPFPAFTEMGLDFGAGSARMQLVVTSYMVAFAAMSVFHGPLSDAVGRRPVIVWSVAVYVVASLGAALSPDLGVLLAFRVLQGLSAGGATIVSRTIIRDLFEGDQAQVLMSRVAMIFGLAPAVAPVVGGAVLQLGPWPLVFVFMAALGLVLIAATVLVLPESHPPERRVPLRPASVVSGLVAVARLPAFHRVAWAATLAFAAQFLYIGGAAIFVVDLLGLGELDFWVFFVPMIGSMVVGSWISGRAAGRITGRRLVGAGFAVSLAGGAVGVALAASPLATDLPWAVVGPSVLALGNGMSYPTLQLMLLDLFPERRGTVVSAASFVTLMVNAVTAALVTPVVGVSTLGLAVTALVVVAAGQLCWWRHRVVEDREAAGADHPVPEHPEALEPTDLM